MRPTELLKTYQTLIFYCLLMVASHVAEDISRYEICQDNNFQSIQNVFHLFLLLPPH